MDKTENLLSKKEYNSMVEGPYFESLRSNGIPFEFISVGDVTFKKGRSESIHSWFRLTPSFSPELVRFYIKYFSIDEKNEVLDPFNGKGTTIIECKKKNINSFAVELNPLLYKITKNSIVWNFDLHELSNQKNFILKEYLDLKESFKNQTVEEFCDKKKISIPKIYDVFRWWKKDVLKDLLILKLILKGEKLKEFEKIYFIILSTISLDCANIHRNHPTISFDDNHARRIDVWGEFESNFDKILSDLTQVNKIKSIGESIVVNGDSTKLSNYTSKRKFDFLITSPPYPNRYSYIHTTRPQLFFMDIIDDRKEATELDLKAIGGTWGRATSNLQKDFLEPKKEIKEFLTYVEELRPKSLLMCNYATKYFNMMYDHILELKKVCKKGFKGVYVVGNSRLSGVEIYTEIILSKIFVKVGFDLEVVHIYRKRGGKKKLYETGVVISLE